MAASEIAADWKRRIAVGKHQRYECVSRPGEWCRGISSYPGRVPDCCTSCPTRRFHPGPKELADQGALPGAREESASC